MNNVDGVVSQIEHMGLSGADARKILQDKPSLTVEQVVNLLLEQVPSSPPTQGDEGPPALVDADDVLPGLTADAAIVVPAGPTTTATTTTNADDELERVMQLSLQEHRDREMFHDDIKGGKGYKDPENPFDRKRVSPDMPAGIKNVGNTCYINSLLQAFFMYPEFRLRIFAVDAPPGQMHGSKLIHELQLLFTRMLLTERKYVDPQPLLEFTSHRGAQEDPTELFLSLLEKMRDGVAKRPAKYQKTEIDVEDSQGTLPMDLDDDDDNNVELEEDSKGEDLIAHYFEGTVRQSLKAVEENGEPVVNESKEEFQQIICNIPVVGQDLILHDLLDLYTGVTEIDGYVTPQGHETQARRGVWFEELPPILTIQLQRVAWINNALQKNNTKVVFDKVMYMDRYLARNSVATVERRKMVASLRDERDNLYARMGSLKSYNGSDMSIVDILQHAAHFLEQSGSTEAVATRKSIENFVDSSGKEIDDLEAEMDSINSRIDSAYDDFPSEYKYHLHAILVHSGSPDMGGHYWAYIVDHGATGEWFKFNDVTVTMVPEFEEIASQSYGDNVGVTSAYALVYLRESERRAWNDDRGIPQWAADMVESDNEVFRTELQTWRVAHPLELSNDEKLDRIADLRVLIASDEPLTIVRASSLARYGKVRGVSDRILETLLADNLKAQLPDPTTEEEQKMVDTLSSDFDLFCRAMQLILEGMQEWFGQGQGRVPDYGLIAARFSGAIYQASVQILTPDFYNSLLKALAVVIQKGMFSLTLALDGVDLSGTRLQAGLALWNATLRLPLEHRTARMQGWRDLKSRMFGKFGTLKDLINGDRASPISSMTGYESKGGQMDIELICDQFELQWSQVVRALE